LFYGERPAAFALCRANGAWLTGELCGYDSALSQLSPGNTLMAYILERLFAEQRFQRLDFGTGEADYKAFFATGSVPCADVYYFRRSVTNIALVIAHWATAVVWQCTTRILDMLNVRNRLKKLARNGWKRSHLVSSREPSP
jgi:CelD/BcsL family acetyltransferase involved in cellulose biosynthesis